MPGLVIGIVIGVIVLLLVIYAISVYNKLIQLRLRVDNQWAQVDVLLKKRFDLIPNLVETVKGYAKHESETFENVINARNKGMSAKSTEEALESERDFQGALGRLFALSEAYPELKANENFLSLQGDLRDMESQIGKYRQFYNDSVLIYNRSKAIFPNNIIASIFNFEDRTFFAVDEGESTAPKVSF